MGTLSGLKAFKPLEEAQQGCLLPSTIKIQLQLKWHSFSLHSMCRTWQRVLQERFTRHTLPCLALSTAPGPTEDLRLLGRLCIPRAIPWHHKPAKEWDHIKEKDHDQQWHLKLANSGAI
eukprot:1159608-Pelagomonas_calceolata.AAC.4